MFPNTFRKNANKQRCFTHVPTDYLKCNIVSENVQGLANKHFNQRKSTR